MPTRTRASARGIQTAATFKLRCLGGRARLERGPAGSEHSWAANPEPLAPEVQQGCLLSPVLRTSLQRAPETPLTTSCSIVLSRWAAAAPDEGFEQRRAAWGRNQLKQGRHAGAPQQARAGASLRGTLHRLC